MKTIELKFEGYWLDENKNRIPDCSGIYCVYSCKYNPDTNKVFLKQLLYIGESGNVKLRLQSHERMRDWVDELNPGEKLCYSVAPVVSADRERAEAALIFEHKPPLNTEHKKEFIYPQVKILVSGCSKFLHPEFLSPKN